MIISISIRFLVPGGSLLLPTRIWWVYRGFSSVSITVTKILSAEYDSNTIFSVLSSETGGNIPATISFSRAWPVCSVFLGRVITCSHRVYLWIQLVLCRWVVRPYFSFRCSCTINSRILLERNCHTSRHCYRPRQTWFYLLGQHWTFFIRREHFTWIWHAIYVTEYNVDYRA